jgi:hypothetical protein
METAAVDDNTQWVTQQTWEDALDQRLAERLMRPVSQPGVIDPQMARSILARSHHLRDRLSLLAQQQQRWSGVHLLKPGDTPIVYAQLQPQASNITNKTITNKIITTNISQLFTPVSTSDASTSDASTSDNILPVVQARLREIPSSGSDLLIQRQLFSSAPDQHEGGQSVFLPETRPVIPDRSINAPSNSLPMLIQRQPVEITSQQQSAPQFENPGSFGSLPIVQAKEVNFGAIASLSSPVLPLSTSLLNASEPDSADLRTGLRTVDIAHPTGFPISNPALNPAMPIVQAIAPDNVGFPTPHEPLVFSRPRGAAVLASQESFPGDEAAYGATNGALGRAIAPAIRHSPTANSNPVDPVIPVARVEVNQTPPETLKQSSLDLEVLVNTVERQIMRRLVIERERRGLR